MSKNDVSNCVSMAGYLDRIGAGKVLLDRGPLSFDWTPPSIGWQGKRAGITSFNVHGNRERKCQRSSSSCWPCRHWKDGSDQEIWGRCSKGNGWHQKDRSFARKL